MEPEPKKRSARTSARKLLSNLEKDSEESDLDSDYM